MVRIALAQVSAKEGLRSPIFCYCEYCDAKFREHLGAESYANVAVLCSLQQAYGKQMSYPMAISRMLSDEQIPHLKRR